MNQGQCPVCDYGNVALNSSGALDQLYHYDCPRCGPFTITDYALIEIENIQEHFKIKLSAWIREKKEFKESPPKITSYTVKGEMENLPNYSVAEKLTKLLQVIKKRSGHLGDLVELTSETDFPVAWAENKDELFYLAKGLKRKGYLEPFDDTFTKTTCILTAEGIEHLEKQPHKESFGKINHRYIVGQANKCDTKISDGDNDGAITNARTLVEAVLNEILIKNGEDSHNFNGDLLKLYKRVQKILDLEPNNKDVDDTLNQYLRGLIGVVSGLSGLRNKMSDSHVQKVKPEKRHAKLTVDSAKTLAEFLFEEMIAMQDKVSSRT